MTRRRMFLCWMLMIMMVVSSSSSTLPRWHYSGQRQSFRSIQSSPSFYRHLLHMTNTNNNNQLTNNTTTTTTTSTTLSSLRQSTLAQLLVPSSFALAALAYVSLGTTEIIPFSHLHALSHALSCLRITRCYDCSQRQQRREEIHISTRTVVRNLFETRCPSQPQPSASLTPLPSLPTHFITTLYAKLSTSPYIFVHS